MDHLQRLRVKLGKHSKICTSLPQLLFWLPESKIRIEPEAQSECNHCLVIQQATNHLSSNKPVTSQTTRKQNWCEWRPTSLKFAWRLHIRHSFIHVQSYIALLCHQRDETNVDEWLNVWLWVSVKLTANALLEKQYKIHGKKTFQCRRPTITITLLLVMLLLLNLYGKNHIMNGACMRVSWLECIKLSRLSVEEERADNENVECCETSLCVLHLFSPFARSFI